jgi:hypothetical protein
MITLGAAAQTYDTNNDVVETFAGYGIPGYVDAQGQLAEFSSPSQIAADTAGNLYVLDSGNYRIRKITPDGTVSTLAGGGSLYEGYGTNVSLSWGSPGSMAMDRSNTLWLVLANAYGYGSSYLLSIGTNGYVAIQNGGLTNLGSYSGLCFDSANNLYYSGGNRIYRYTPATGSSLPIAGTGVASDFDGQGPVYSTFSNPTCLACDTANNIYVWDGGNAAVRRIDTSQKVTSIAGGNGYYYNSADGVGTNAYFSGVSSMFADNAGNIYFVCGSSVRKMDVQTNVVTLAGNFNQYSGNYMNGPGNLAQFSGASGGCFSHGIIFIADNGNQRIRQISFNAQPQVVAGAVLGIGTFTGITLNGVIGRTYQIQSSSNSINWGAQATLVLPANPYLWIDPNPVKGNKFYRAVLLP